ncbi:MAG TPA: sigma factor, partial [Bacteroidales bacterium]|nr:sigma factor [Bacteroidales bacterium]
MDQQKENEILVLIRDPLTRSKAFSLLVSETSQSLYWQIRKMVLSHDDANDILQNTYMKAWSNIEQFRGDSKISTWMF